jgi:hypothetical protein
MNHRVSAPLTPNIFRNYYWEKPIPVAVQSKAWNRGHSHAGIAGSSHVEEQMSLFCSCRVLSVRGLCDVPIFVQRSLSEVCLSVISKPQERCGPGLFRAFATQERNYGKTQHVFLNRELGD